jgi:uncharacterized protein YciI
MNMAIFTVMMAHPDGAGWNTHLKPHVDYLLKILKEGKLIASGPLNGTKLRSGFLIISAADRAEVETIVANDPFAIEKLIVELVITEWDPVFGAFHDISSKQLPGGMGSMG